MEPNQGLTDDTTTTRCLCLNHLSTVNLIRVKHGVEVILIVILGLNQLS